MKRPALISFLLCCMTLLVPAQTGRTTAIPAGLFSAQELEKQRKDALKEIELTSQLLNETSATAKTSLNRLNLLAQQLLFRKKVISILGQEINEIDRKMKILSDEIEILNKDLAKTKENYAKSMQNQQQEQRTTQYKILLILSADNLSQSYRRMRYLREYADWQKDEGERIIKKQAEIASRMDELEKTRKEKQDLFAQRENENRKLENEEKQQKKEVRELDNKQKDLQRQLQQKRKQADALNKQIEQLIAEEIKKSEKNKPAATTETASSETTSPETIPSGTAASGTAASGTTSSGTAASGTTSSGTAASETASSGTAASGTAASGTASSGTAASGTAASETASSGTAASGTAANPSAAKGGYVLLESEAILSRDFANNKGKLPFPLTGKYTVVSSFGEQQHQELSHVRTNNNGIDIQTTAGAEACVIFKGVVTRVFVMPGFNNNVIVRHGDYLTVYSNLSNVYVKAGDVVSARQTIGKIFTDTAKGNETILHFQIWKERTKLNPEAWIK